MKAMLLRVSDCMTSNSSNSSWYSTILAYCISAVLSLCCSGHSLLTPHTSPLTALGMCTLLATLVMPSGGTISSSGRALGTICLMSQLQCPRVTNSAFQSLLVVMSLKPFSPIPGASTGKAVKSQCRTGSLNFPGGCK